MSGPERVPPSTSPSRRRLVAFWFAAAAAVGILLVYVVHPALSGYRFPIGPDGPVYTWLARAAGASGFADAPGGGPGVPALTLALGSLLGTEPIETVMLLGPVLATACGLAAGALLEVTLGEDRLRTAAGVVLTAAFTAYLAGGWLANVAMVASFLVAVAALSGAASSWRAVWAAAALLAAAGLAHRVFVLIGATILLATAAWQLLRASRGSRRAQGAVPALRLGAAAIVGPAAALLIGGWIGAGPRIPGDTSQDGFFRRVGLRALLLDRYRERFLGDAARAGVPVAVALGLASPLAGTGREEGRGFLKEVLAAWAVLSVGGIVVLAATGWGPPYRVIQFAFFLPIAAAAGLAILARRSRSIAIVAGLAGIAFVLTSMVGWFRQAPAFSADEVAASARAGAAASSLPPGTPLVFLVDTDEPAAAYHVTRAWNVIRMGVPAERIEEVRLAVGQPEDLLARRPTVTGDREHDRISEVYLQEVMPLLDGAAILVVRRFNPGGFEDAADSGVTVAEGVVALSRGEEMDPVHPGEAGRPEGLAIPAFFILSLAALAVLGSLGWGWSRWILSGGGSPGVYLAAPSVGAAVAIVSTVAADRVGLLPGSGGALAVIASLGALGYVLAYRNRD